MSCDFKPVDRPKCDIWTNNLRDALERGLKNNSKTTQLNIEQQIGQLNSDDDHITCIDNHTGFLKTPVDEFCSVVGKLKSDGKITDQRTGNEIDSFCKNLNFNKAIKLFSRQRM